MELYILRHGTTVWNKEHRIQGSTDTSLDSLGLEMARRTGERFRELGIRFQRVYSSPMRRAFETARLVLGETSADTGKERMQGGMTEKIVLRKGSGRQEAASRIITDPRLRELSFGMQEGCFIKDLILEEAPFIFFKSDPAEYDRRAALDPSMESLTELCDRTGEFLREEIEMRLREETEERIPERILISAHGACNKGLLMHIRGERDMRKFWGGGLQPNCGVDVVHFDVSSGSYRILEENRIFYPEELLKEAGNLLSGR